MSSSKHLIITLISAVSVIGVASVMLSTKRQTYEVEDFTDKNKKSVATWLESNSIPSDMVIYTHGYSDSVGKGKVISQSISPGGKLSSPDYMIVRISDGKNPDSKTLVPDFTGKKLDEIRKWFEDNGFDNVTYQTQERDDLDEGSFLVVTPKSGSQVTTDDKITVVTSVKPAPVSETPVTDNTEPQTEGKSAGNRTENTATAVPEQNQTVSPLTPSESGNSATKQNNTTAEPVRKPQATTDTKNKPSNPAPVEPVRPSGDTPSSDEPKDQTTDEPSAENQTDTSESGNTETETEPDSDTE